MSDMMKFYNTLIQMGVPHALAIKSAEELQHMLDNQDYPSNYWECKATGAYKECYFIGSVVVKFACEDNYTMDREALIYEETSEVSFSHAFAKTVYIPLGKTLPAAFIDDDSSDAELWDSEKQTYVENPDYKGPQFNCIVVQERIDKILCDTSWNFYSPTHPLIDENGNPIPTNSILEGLGYREWLQAFIDFYGVEALNDFCEFCDQNHMYDMHTGNLGYRKDGSPVIFDFLS